MWKSTQPEAFTVPQIPYINMSSVRDNTSEDRLIRNRLLDSANTCYQRNIPVATDFLDLHKQTLFETTVIKELPPVCHIAMGGYDIAERKLILFLPYEGAPYTTPYDIIKIIPATPKFSEELTHRDFMGAVMNLGISRDKLGDIILCNNSSGHDCEVTAYLFCRTTVTDYILQNLSTVKHTVVNVSVIDSPDFDYTPEYTEIINSVASIRLDAVISLGFGSSRSHLISYIEEGKVAVNGRIITSNAYNLKENDIISVRGLGKIRFAGTVSTTKKGRIMVRIHKFI